MIDEWIVEETYKNIIKNENLKENTNCNNEQVVALLCNSIKLRPKTLQVLVRMIYFFMERV